MRKKRLLAVIAFMLVAFLFSACFGPESEENSSAMSSEQDVEYNSTGTSPEATISAEDAFCLLQEFVKDDSVSCELLSQEPMNSASAGTVYFARCFVPMLQEEDGEIVLYEGKTVGVYTIHPTTGEIKQLSQYLDELQAIELVKTRVGEQDFLVRYACHYIGADTEGVRYSIQAYTLNPIGEDPQDGSVVYGTGTINYYYVDVFSGKIEPMFPEH